MPTQNTFAASNLHDVGSESAAYSYINEIVSWIENNVLGESFGNYFPRGIQDDIVNWIVATEKWRQSEVATKLLTSGLLDALERALSNKGKSLQFEWTGGTRTTSYTFIVDDKPQPSPVDPPETPSDLPDVPQPTPPDQGVPDTTPDLSSPSDSIDGLFRQLFNNQQSILNFVNDRINDLENDISGIDGSNTDDIIRNTRDVEAGTQRQIGILKDQLDQLIDEVENSSGENLSNVRNVIDNQLDDLEEDVEDEFDDLRDDIRDQIKDLERQNEAIQEENKKDLEETAEKILQGVEFDLTPLIDALFTLFSPFPNMAISLIQFASQPFKQLIDYIDNETSPEKLAPMKSFCEEINQFIDSVTNCNPKVK